MTSAAQERNAAFLQGLQQLGWTVGQNIQIDYRWSGGTEDATQKYAAELVSLAPDVIFASGSAAAGPLRRATRTVPIVFTNVIDPVGSGYVESLGSTRWQYHRLYALRIQHWWKMAGASEGDRAERHPRCGPA